MSGRLARKGSLQVHCWVGMASCEGGREGGREWREGGVSERAERVKGGSEGKREGGREGGLTTESLSHSRRGSSCFHFLNMLLLYTHPRPARPCTTR